MDLSRGIGSSQFLALGNHREDTAEYSGAAGIDLDVLRLEYLGEVLRHTLAYAVVLAFAHRCQVAQTQLRTLIFAVKGRKVGNWQFDESLQLL